MPEHPVLTAAARFRAQVLSREREAANRLVQTYGRAYTRLSPAIEALSQRIARMDAPGPSRASLARLESLRSLQSQVVSELNTFSTYADTEISRAATAAIQSGLLDSRALSVAAMGGTGPGAKALAAGWDMLPTESVETMLGFLADESPLHTALVNKLGPAVAQRMSDALVDGIALGMNPRKVADIVRRELGVGLTWALTTARTAQINAYREAARANYVANSHIIGGWTWLSALGNRTCCSCLNMHGSFHPVTESLTDHHAGRCLPLPYVKQAAAFGLPQPEIEPGGQWFRRQTEDFQRERLGPGRFDAWKAGKFDFRDLSQPYNDPVYGEMLREATLKGLLTGKAKGKTLTFGTPAPVGVAPVEAVTVAPRTAASVREELAKSTTGVPEQLNLIDQEYDEALKQYRQAWKDMTDMKITAESSGDFIRERARKRELATEWYEKSEKLLKQKTAAQSRFADEARRLVYVENPSSIDINLKSKLKRGDARLMEFETGKAEFEKMVSGISAPLDIKAAGNKLSGRSFFDHADSAIAISPNGKSSVVVHEMGHWWENADATIHRKALDFLERRTAGEEAEKLSKIYPGSNYGPREVAKKDKFQHAYTGKIYIHNGEQYATEIVSMGLEAMYKDPARFAADDPDFFDFIYNLARGQ